MAETATWRKAQAAGQHASLCTEGRQLHLLATKAADDGAH